MLKKYIEISYKGTTLEEHIKNGIGGTITLKFKKAYLYFLDKFERNNLDNCYYKYKTEDVNINYNYDIYKFLLRKTDFYVNDSNFYYSILAYNINNIILNSKKPFSISINGTEKQYNNFITIIKRLITYIAETEKLSKYGKRTTISINIENKSKQMVKTESEKVKINLGEN